MMMMMSGDKNTVVTSVVDQAVKVLNDLGAPYALEVKTAVPGRGVGDHWYGDGKVVYELRRLQRHRTVILEQMIQHQDCDVDDRLVSKTFSVDDEPSDWQYVVVVEQREDGQ